MRKRKKVVSKCADELLLVKSTVTEIIEQNTVYNERIKNVFKCKSLSADKPDRMCVMWGRSSFEVGDEVHMKGRFNNEVFLVWSMMIVKVNKQELSDE